MLASRASERRRRPQPNAARISPNGPRLFEFRSAKGTCVWGSFFRRRKEGGRGDAAGVPRGSSEVGSPRGSRPRTGRRSDRVRRRPASNAARISRNGLGPSGARAFAARVRASDEPRRRRGCRADISPWGRVTADARKPLTRILSEETSRKLDRTSRKTSREYISDAALLRVARPFAIDARVEPRLLGRLPLFQERRGFFHDVHRDPAVFLASHPFQDLLPGPGLRPNHRRDFLLEQLLLSLHFVRVDLRRNQRLCGSTFAPTKTKEAKTAFERSCVRRRRRVVGRRASSNLEANPSTDYGGPARNVETSQPFSAASRIVFRKWRCASVTFAHKTWKSDAKPGPPYLRAGPDLGRTSTVGAEFCSVGLLVPSS